VDGEPGTRPPASGRQPQAQPTAWVESVPVGVLVGLTVVLAVLVGVVLTGSGHASSRPTAAPAAGPGSPLRPSAADGAAAQGTADQAAARADLAAQAARLTSPVALTSPAAWDRWTPAGRPSSGTDDVATCPTMAGRLTAALGTAMGYRVGALPGAGGCTWGPAQDSTTVPAAPTPSPATTSTATTSTAATSTAAAPASAPYVVAVGFVADGRTAAQVGAGYRDGPARCPSAPVGAVAPGAVLARCADAAATTYTLVVPDRRTPGVWTLGATARTGAPHPASYLLDAVIAGAVRNYG
jgi:hypothetical protein